MSNFFHQDYVSPIPEGPQVNNMISTEDEKFIIYKNKIYKIYNEKNFMAYAVCMGFAVGIFTILLSSPVKNMIEHVTKK